MCACTSERLLTTITFKEKVRGVSVWRGGRGEAVVLTILKVSSSDVRYHPGRLEFDRY